MKRTKITAKFIIGYDGSDHVIFTNAELVYAGDTILFVGYDYPEPVDEVLNYGDALISPGFIDLNALGDVDHDLIHNEAPPALQPSLLWSQAYYENGPHEVQTPEDEAFKSLYAYVQLIRHGVTTAMPITSVFYKRWAETYEELAAAVEHAGRLGLRIYLGPSFQSGIQTVKQDGSIEVRWRESEGQAGLERAVAFVKQFDGAYDGRIRGMLAPERIETITPDLLRESKRWSDELKCPIRLHAAQGPYEFGEMRRRHGKTPIQYLSDIGFLGPQTSIPHTVYVTGSRVAEGAPGDDLGILAETGTTVIHCPVIMARYNEALESFGRYQRAGIRLALGTDTFPPDIFQNIRVGSYLARVMDQSPIGNTFADFFRAATLGGARALGRDDLGRLAPGAKADMIVIRLDDFHFGVLDDPIRTLFISGTGQDVQTVIINGRVVMEERVIPGVDLEALQARATRYFANFKTGYLERDYRQLPPTQLFPSSFQVISRK